MDNSISFLSLPDDALIQSLMMLSGERYNTWSAIGSFAQICKKGQEIAEKVKVLVDLGVTIRTGADYQGFLNAALKYRLMNVSIKLPDSSMFILRSIKHESVSIVCLERPYDFRPEQTTNCNQVLKLVRGDWRVLFAPPLQRRENQQLKSEVEREIANQDEFQEIREPYNQEVLRRRRRLPIAGNPQVFEVYRQISVPLPFTPTEMDYTMGFFALEFMGF